MEFDWDEHNLAHIALHGVTSEEFEEAYSDLTLFVKEEERHGEVRRSYMGRTRNKRILLLVSTIRSDRVRCVTAFPANRSFRNAFLAQTGEY